MRYNVIVRPTALEDLAEIWLTSSNRQEVTDASNHMDHILGHDPGQQGTVTFDTIRSIRIGPLGITFEVIDADRIVYVLSVEALGSGSP
jgi:mRNA-degrading endonuclease RelE of RelBE toxin-antitoxin system